MKELTFDTGLVTYCVNGKCEVTFNPTDGAFMEKLYRAFEEMDKKQEEYKTMLSNAKTSQEAFRAIGKLDGEMREAINGTFGRDICSEVFGAMNLYALAGGFPVWANFLLSILDEMDSTAAKEQQLISPRVEKYTRKYHK